MTIYLDHAATTPMDPRVAESMRRHEMQPLNPSSVHRAGQAARRLLEECRERLARAAGVENPTDLVFTSGATESANLALRGLVDSQPGRKLRVLSSIIEHSCVFHTLEVLARQDRIDLEYLPVGGDGRVEPPVAKALVDRPADILCLMHANNETGVIQDVGAAAELRRAGLVRWWVCDAAQTIGKVELPRADFLFFCSHKIYGPPGIGALCGPGVTALVSQITGGPQEAERRAGTPSVLLALGFAEAVSLLSERRESCQNSLRELEELFLSVLASAGIAYRINGSTTRLPGFLNISFPGLQAMDAVIALDQSGICVSPGSACSTGVVSISRVLSAMFPTDEARAAGGVRITFGRTTTREEVTAFVEALTRLAPRR